MAENRSLNDIEFAALLVSRVCHDLVSPVGAVVNGLEVLEDETDNAMRADALRLVAVSAESAAARLQFARIAYGAAGSVGAELDLTEVSRVVVGLLRGGKIEIDWQPNPINWPKDWAKLLMNCIIVGADCLPRGGRVQVNIPDSEAPQFTIVAKGTIARISAETERALVGDPGITLDGRLIQPFLTHQLAKGLNAGLNVVTGEGEIRIHAG